MTHGITHSVCSCSVRSGLQKRLAELEQHKRTLDSLAKLSTGDDLKTAIDQELEPLKEIVDVIKIADSFPALSSAAKIDPSKSEDDQT